MKVRLFINGPYASRYEETIDPRDWGIDPETEDVEESIQDMLVDWVFNHINAGFDISENNEEG